MAKNTCPSYKQNILDSLRRGDVYTFVSFEQSLEFVIMDDEGFRLGQINLHSVSS